MSVKSHVRLEDRGESNNCAVGNFCSARTTVRSASLHLRRILLRSTARLLSFVEANVPT